jgi:putative spermidine/putrescine transport system permease protein
MTAAVDDAIASPAATTPARRPSRFLAALPSYLQAAPLALILGAFLLAPVLMIAVVSFWDYDFARPIRISSSPTTPTRSARG